MKELSIEEKAQRYDEAIKIAKDNYHYQSYPEFIRVDVVFPELTCKDETWSEEDEKMIRGLIAICDEWAGRHSYYPVENCDIEMLKNWLKSFKERYTWKPSEEQMEALDEVYKTHGANNVCRRVIFNLMEDLKKLM